jgi:hypothetical protein
MSMRWIGCSAVGVKKGPGRVVRIHGPLGFGSGSGSDPSQVKARMSATGSAVWRSGLVRVQTWVGIELVGDGEGEADVGRGGVVDPGVVVVAAAVDDLDDQLRIVGREDPEQAASLDADRGERDGVSVARGAAVEGRRPVELDLPAAVAGRLVDAERRGIGGAQRDRGSGRLSQVSRRGRPGRQTARLKRCVVLCMGAPEERASCGSQSVSVDLQLTPYNL